MSKLSFIHAADLHLGSAPQVNREKLPTKIADKVQQANFIAFRRIVDTALVEEVDFLLLAGDVYDREERSITANRFFNDQCQRLAEAEIPVYVIAGNHDPLTERRQLFRLPDNVIEFSCQEPESYQVPSGEQGQLAQICGQSYETKYQSKKVYSHFKVENQENFNIGLLHTQLEKHDTKYVPASKNDLANQDNIDYWALGHIHQCRLERGAEPVIVFPGIPQGRDFGETGLRGCLLVTVDAQQAVKTEFVPTSPFVFLRPTVNLDQGEEQPVNLEELTKLIVDQAEELAADQPQLPEGLAPYAKDWSAEVTGYLVEWIVEGRGELHQTLQEQPFEAKKELVTKLRNEAIAPFIWTESIKFNTRAQLPDLATLSAEDNEVFAEIAKLIELCRTDEEWAASLKKELGNIWNQRVDHENINPEKFQLTEEDYQDIIGQAKNLVIERILARRD